MTRRKPVRLTPQEADLRERAEARVAGLGLAAHHRAMLLDLSYDPHTPPGEHYTWLLVAPAADLRDYLGLHPREARETTMEERLERAAPLLRHDAPAGG